MWIAPTTCCCCRCCGCCHLATTPAHTYRPSGYGTISHLCPMPSPATPRAHQQLLLLSSRHHHYWQLSICTIPLLVPSAPSSCLRSLPGLAPTTTSCCCSCGCLASTTTPTQGLCGYATISHHPPASGHYLVLPRLLLLPSRHHHYPQL